MKILLINLPRQFETKDFTMPDYFLDNLMQYPPLGLLSIAALVPKKHSLEILDASVKDMPVEKVIDYIIKASPDVLGISAVTRRLYAMRLITKKIKELLPNIKIIAGGPHVNYFPIETMRLGDIDYALSGFAEKTFPQLIEAIDGGEKEEQLKTISGLYFKNDSGILNNLLIDAPLILDDLPFPDRKLINLYDYCSAADKEPMTTMYSSRGCPNRCVYCDVQEKKWHYRTAKNVVDEMEEIVKMGIKFIYMHDDTFNINRDRAINICKEIIRRKLKIRWSTRGRVYPFDEEMAMLFKKSGGVRWHIGIETLDASLMKYIQKGITMPQVEDFFKICHKYKIETMAYFIIGFPNETVEYRKNLYNEVIKLRPTYVFFNVLCPLPKTQYYQALLALGEAKTDFWAEFVKNPTPDFVIPHSRDKALQKELLDISDKYSRKFYFNPVFILKEFWRSLFYPRALLFKIRGGLVMLYKIFIKKYAEN